MDKKTPLFRLASAAITGALILTAPGMEAWAVTAQVVKVNVSVPVNTFALPARQAGSALTHSPLQNLSLGASLAPSLAPSVVPSVSVSPTVLPGSLISPSAAQTAPSFTVEHKAVVTEASAFAALTPGANALAVAPVQETGDVETMEKAAGPRSRFRSAAKRIGAGIRSLRDLFTGRKVEALATPVGAAVEDLDSGASKNIPEAGLKSSQSQGPPKATGLDTRGDKGNEPPVPPVDGPGKDDGKGKKGRDWWGLGKVAVLFIAAMVMAQIGVESLGAAMPDMMEKTFKDVSIVADIAILGSVFGILGRIVGPMVVKKFSLKTAYLGSSLIKLLSVSVMVGLLATAHMTIPVLGIFFAFHGFLSGISITAEKAIPPAVLGQDQEKLENFGAWKQTLLEVMGSLVPIAAGAVIGSLGFIPAIVAFPVTFALSLLMLWKWLKIPAKIEEMRKLKLAEAKGEGKPTGVGGPFKEFWRKISHGAKVVWKNPALKYSFLAYTAFMIINPFLYTIFAPQYGVRLLGGEHPGVAGVYTLLTGLYSLGGLLGGLLMLREQKKIKKTPPAGGMEAHLRKSMLRWMWLGTLGLAAIATMALPLPTLGALIALPAFLSWAGSLTLPALALIPFGIFQVVANIKQENYFIAKAPPEDVNDAIGFLGSASLAITTVGLVAMKFLFSGKLPFGLRPFASFMGLTGFTPFIVIAALMVPLAAYYIYLTRKLAKASSTDVPKP